MDSLAFVHEAFHWLDSSLNNYVVSFSISNEVYRKILLEQIYSSGCIEGISVLGEMLCVNSRYLPHTEDIFKIWVMKDYGVKESWTELFNIQGTGLYSVVPNFRSSTCFGCSFRTSEGPYGLWPQSDELAIHKGFVYTESLLAAILDWQPFLTFILFIADWQPFLIGSHS
ncbi:uncharacterized protein LOC129895570 [Solanum dulcamara]|uniref:uncharacterized protein LOC129895570 n=1 Tax=Solanum dulcamara TaxID=45834 RepID=UPI0024868E91|nr:uncharacterized protein LOC129895570 [Solanum dulcamara]